MKNIHYDAQITVLLSPLKERFEQNMQRHPNIEWSKVEERLRLDVDKQTGDIVHVELRESK